MTPDPLPPLADVLQTRVASHYHQCQESFAIEDAKEREYRYAMSSAKLTEASAIQYLAAPYDAELARLRARVAELEAEVNSQRARDQALASGEHYRQVAKLEAELAPFRELAREAASDPEPPERLDGMVCASQWIWWRDRIAKRNQRLAAMHKEAPSSASPQPPPSP